MSTGKHVMHSVLMLSLGAALVLSACEQVPTQIATSPSNERGIDQDISATRDNGSTLENLTGGASTPWRLNQY